MFDFSCYQEKIMRHLQGRRYEGLIFAGIPETSISKFIMTTNSDFMVSVRRTFLQELDPFIKDLFQIWSQHTEEHWQNLSKDLPEWRAVIRKRMEIRSLWRRKPL